MNLTKFAVMRNIFLSLCMLAFVLGCDTYEEPLYNNPIDPMSPDFTLPEASLVVDFESNATINETSVTLNWTGKYANSHFAYMLVGCDANYSSYSDEKTKNYNFLDEGTYTFLVKEKAGSYEQDTPDSISFTIDAIQETALVLKKWHSAANTGDELTIDICLESVENLNGLSTKLNFSIDQLELTKIEALKDNIQGETDAVAFIASELAEANSSGVIEIDMLLLGSNNVEFSGDASICKLYFKIIGSSQTTIEFSEADTKLRNKDNQNLIANQLRGAVIN